MDIAAMAMSMKQADLQTQISCALMKNVKDTAEVQGEAIAQMIDSVPSPAGVGENIDIKL